MRRMVIGFVLLLLMVGNVSALERGATNVVYDSHTDRMTIEANEVLLKDILIHIGLQTGIEVFWDASIDRTISVNLKDKSIEDVIKVVTKGVSYTVTYSDKRNSAGQVVIMAISVLPKGKYDSPFLVPLTSLQSLAVVKGAQEYYQTEYLATANVEQSVTDYLSERWEMRLETLPENVQKQIKDIIEKERSTRAENKALLAKRRALQKEELTATTKVENERLEAIKENDPAYYQTLIEHRQRVELEMSEKSKTRQMVNSGDTQ